MHKAKIVEPNTAPPWYYGHLLHKKIETYILLVNRIIPKNRNKNKLPQDNRNLLLVNFPKLYNLQVEEINCFPETKLIIPSLQ